MPGLRFTTEATTKDGESTPSCIPPLPAGDAATPRDSSALIEQILTSRKGLGMAAAKDIKRGTRIISEEPLLIINTNKEVDKHLLQAFFRLSPTQHDQLAELSDCKQNKCPKALTVFINELEKHHQYSGRYLTAAAQDFAKMHTIFYANAVMLGPDAQFGIGISPTYSRLNHSCTPNVQHSYNATLGREVVHAIKDIPKGEELVTAYVSLQRPTSLRVDEVVKKWGFECKCETCCGADQLASERRRQRLYEIDQGFAFLKEPVDHRIYATASLHGMIPKTDGVALRWAEESVELLKIEGLVGMDMAKAYRECSNYSLREGQLEKATAYARKELDIQITCLGEDTAYLAPADDARVWIKHIEDMSGVEKVRLRMNEKRVQKELKKVEKKAAKRAGKR
ncbi:uncharacterized protein RCC_10793 [Ramularia collo-cygni]|uniref:SET domain-containing protein n=1 Tax=Ramularia collo-cygni TaxID=112498 RepID=A0A2D3VGF7_9PEZI|nr:uncharacterized protein RCC_10793 [Ramularia collo-cygni]CZT25065.1 uncharacterized protein RCC_10793 [Ramularia collo-cygni]